MQPLLSTVKPNSAEEKRSEVDNIAQLEKFMTVVKRGKKKLEGNQSHPQPKSKYCGKGDPNRKQRQLPQRLMEVKYTDIIRKEKSYVFPQECRLQVAKHTDKERRDAPEAQEVP